MTCNWLNGDYFAKLRCNDRRSHTALEMLVNALHSEKERTISAFLSHSGSEDLLWSLVQLLGHEVSRVAGNAAYIIGTLAEFELGCHRIISLAKNQLTGSTNLLCELTRMLTSADPESVMNAAGTLGTLAENAQGREWMLSEPCIQTMLDQVTDLLHVENLWTASNAALVLARLSISEEGCTCILKHPNSQRILVCLIQALGVDEAGRGMNAAFAVGRLCDIGDGRQRLLSLPDSENMISSLVEMLSGSDAGASKNACFALSCLAANLEGHSHLLNDSHSDDVLKILCKLLSAQDSETGWFAAMTLRTLASQPKGCMKLRGCPEVYETLKKVEQLADVNSDLKEEITITLEILKPLSPPDAPLIKVLNSRSCHASWNKITANYVFDIWYQLFEGDRHVYSGPVCQCEVSSLLPHRTYSFRVQALTEMEESALSESTTVTMDEDLPEAPQNLQILGSTASQLKVGWSPPNNSNGVLKGYYVYQAKNLVEHTLELTSIISGLTSNTAYDIQVCAATVKGKGPKAVCTGSTAEQGTHSPSKPQVQVLGRSEVHVSWEPPQLPLGRITRYDVSMNGKVIYSGTELSCSVHRLTPDTEYSFVVTALTNEGKFDSKVTKKRTAKDEYDPDRPPLYQTPKKEEEFQKAVVHKKMKPSDTRLGIIHSAKASQSSSSTDGSISAVSSQQTHGLQTSADKVMDVFPSSHIQKTKTAIKDVSTRIENGNPRSTRELIPLLPNKAVRLSTADTFVRSGKSLSQKFYASHTSELIKPSPSITLSYISIHGGDDQNLELNTAGSDDPIKKTVIQSPRMHNNINHTLRVERSRTSFLPSKLQLARNCKLTKLDSHETVHTDAFNSNLDNSHHTVQSTPDLRPQSSPGDHCVHLPKPKVLHSSYLEGSRASSIATKMSLTQSLPNTRMFKEKGVWAVGERKTELPSFHHRPEKRNNSDHSASFGTQAHSTSNSDSHDAQHEFIHRANTFVASHRPSLKKTHVAKGQLQLIRSASISLADTKSVASCSNKFIPVQLRAQPNNLTAGQLHRVNTTLLENGQGTISYKRQDTLASSILRLPVQTSTTNGIMSLDDINKNCNLCADFSSSMKFDYCLARTLCNDCSGKAAFISQPRQILPADTSNDAME